jgi:hypothetical protein
LAFVNIWQDEPSITSEAEANAKTIISAWWPEGTGVECMGEFTVLEASISSAIHEATASLAAECERLRAQPIWEGKRLGSDWDVVQVADQSYVVPKAVGDQMQSAANREIDLTTDLKAAQEEIAGLRESEKAMYETVTAIATALGLEVWGYEELAPAVRVALDERKAAREECERLQTASKERDERGCGTPPK